MYADVPRTMPETDRIAAHGLVKRGLELPVAEAGKYHFALGLPAGQSDLLGHVLGGGTSEERDGFLGVVHDGGARGAANVVSCVGFRLLVVRGWSVLGREEAGDPLLRIG